MQAFQWSFLGRFAEFCRRLCDSKIQTLRPKVPKRPESKIVAAAWLSVCACLLVCLPYLSLCLSLSRQAEADLCVAKERSRQKEDNTLVVHLVCVRTLVHKSVSPDVILCG